MALHRACSLPFPPPIIWCPLCLQILCWGVRDMKRFQLLPVMSPLVEFECGGVAVKSKPIKNTKSNPNFPDPVLSFDVVSFRSSLLLNLAILLGENLQKQNLQRPCM